MATVDEPAVSPRWRKPTITGERILMRPMLAEDAAAMWEMAQDPEGLDLTGTPPGTLTWERTQEWCASRATVDHRLDLAIVELATGEWAGEVVLNEYDPTEESANFRIALRGPAWYGRGLGGEATRLMVRHGFEAVGLRRITLDVLARNPRAIRAYEQAGFRRIAERDDDGERWVDMEITPADLRPAPPAGR